MSRITLFFVFLFIGNALFSQAPFPDSPEVEKFYDTKTLVVLEDNIFSEYNVFIRQAVSDYWELTDFDFISTTEFNALRKDPLYSFIVLTATKFDKDRSGTVYNFINLLLGKDVRQIEDMPEFCAIPLSVQGVEDVEYSHKLAMVLRFMQSHVDHIREDPSMKGKQYLKYYNKFIPEVKNKTILVAEKDMAPGLKTEEAAGKYYPYDLKIVTDAELDRAIMDKAEDTLILHMVSPQEADESGLCFKMLLGTGDAKMYFYGEHKISRRRPDGLLVNDLKRIGRF